MDKIKEQMSKISEEFTYVEQPVTSSSIRDKLPEKFFTADIPKCKHTDNSLSFEGFFYNHGS